ncbi:copper-transporting ATPase 1-like [Varroa jacobsoni]|uniref:copper-transporting ATPase 1-like n=1 Tax=Varroa jacobsoni TaxID=62625 RepID=UPI000BF63E18|nr:copper-transporting ATPase 1-like [Varroa jacobsoni]XP_022688419.1 copper-transporting ATPase 1-like [Varroa jacobsoni]XP_022688420.1 copper-transporting ATPase 1-like [Varroa jacobsoni]
MGGEHGDGNHTTKSSFLLGGLTCDTCVRIIENRLLDLHGVKNVQICLETQLASVEYDFYKLSMSEIVRTVCNLGFSAKPVMGPTGAGIRDVTLLIGGMMCNDCVRKVNEKLRAINGVYKVEVSLTENQASVSYEVTLASVEQLLVAVGELGFVVNLPDNVPLSQVTYHLKDLSCEICATSIERVLVDKEGVHHVEVSLSEKSCSVSFFDYKLKPLQIQEYIEATGYSCELITLEIPPQLKSALFRVIGMSSQSCVGHIEEQLAYHKGVVGIKVSLELNTAAVVFLSQETEAEDIREAVEHLGYNCSLIENLGEKNDDLASETEKVTPDNNETSPLLKAKNDTRSYSSQRSLELALQKSIEHLSKSSRASSRHTLVNVEAANLEKAFFTIKGMTCSSCVSTIENNLKKIRGIHFVLVALLAEKAEVRYNPELISPDAIAGAIDSMGFEAEVLADTQCPPGQLVVMIKGMTCASCVNSIEKAVFRIPGVTSANVVLSTQKGTFTFDGDVAGPRAIVEAIEGAGFEVHLPSSADTTIADRLSHRSEIEKWRSAFLVSLLFGVPTMAIMIFYMVIAPQNGGGHKQTMITEGLSLENLLLFALATPVQFIGGRHFCCPALRSLQHGAANMDVLIVLATTISYLYSVTVLGIAMATRQSMSPMTFFDTVPMLIVFLCLGRWMESVAKGATTEALTKLIELEPTTALLVSSGNHEEKEINKQLVARGDLIKVLPGAKVPVDGCVVSGHGQVDESHITGESLPVDKNPDDIVFSGSLNINGVLLIRATHVGQDTTLGQIVKLVEQAQTSKAPIQQLADRIAGYFVPAVFSLSVITLGVWMFIGFTKVDIIRSFVGKYEGSDLEVTLQFAFRCAITVLSIACPCALGLATPTAVMVGTGLGAKNGIFIKGAEPLELLSQVKIIAFDKTGTITEGKASVTSFTNFSAVVPSGPLVALIGAAESNSEHPIGKAIFAFAVDQLSEEEKELPRCENFEATPGYGLQCEIVYDSYTIYPNETKDIIVKDDGSVLRNPLKTGLGKVNRVLVGNRMWMLNHGVKISGSQDKALETCELEGETAVVCAINGVALAVVSVSDRVRPESRAVVTHLKEKLFKVVLLTGDNKRTANAIAKKVGIRDVIAQVLPRHKAEKIKELRRSGVKVAMVGDGINDSPALIAADVGIALGNATEVAIDAAQVVLIRNDLRDLISAIDLSRKTVHRIRINFVLASVYNIVSIPLAAGMLLPLGLVLLPWVGAGAMAASSLSVLLSSLTLRSAVLERPREPVTKHA